MWCQWCAISPFLYEQTHNIHARQETEKLLWIRILYFKNGILNSSKWKLAKCDVVPPTMTNIPSLLLSDEQTPTSTRKKKKSLMWKFLGIKLYIRGFEKLNESSCPICALKNWIAGTGKKIVSYQVIYHIWIITILLGQCCSICVSLKEKKYVCCCITYKKMKSPNANKWEKWQFKI